MRAAVLAVGLVGFAVSVVLILVTPNVWAFARYLGACIGRWFD